MTEVTIGSNLMTSLQNETEPLHSQERRWLSALLNITQVASNTTSLKDVLYAVSREVIEAIGAWGCNSFLFPERAEFGNYYLIEPVPPSDYKVPDPPDHFTLEALKTMKPVVSENVMVDPRTDKRTMRYFGIKSAIAFPLVFQGKAVAAGFCCFGQTHQFSEEEIEVVMAIASAGAASVANAKLHQENLQLAIAHERNRLAQELHDSVCQSLATTKLYLNLLLRSENLSASATAKVHDAIGLLDQGYSDARDIIHSIRVAGTPTENFPGTFRTYVEDFAARYDISVEYRLSDSDILLLSQEVIMQVSRILGEALSNVRKHAHANHVSISSSNGDGCVQIVIEDDGIGFDPLLASGKNEGHFGLDIMRERTELARGGISFQKVLPHGTRIVLSIPYR